MGSPDFSADTEELRNSGVDIVMLADLSDTIFTKLSWTLDTYPHAGGHGDEIADSFNKHYVPGADAGVKFLGGVTLILQDHGQLTDVVQKQLAEMDDANTAGVKGFIHGRK